MNARLSQQAALNSHRYAELKDGLQRQESLSAKRHDELLCSIRGRPTRLPEHSSPVSNRNPALSAMTSSPSGSNLLASSPHTIVDEHTGDIIRPLPPVPLNKKGKRRRISQETVRQVRLRFLYLIIRFCLPPTVP
jgi:hypothetical protein